MPGGRRPHPRLEGGEGIEPYEMFSHILAEYYELKKEQACTWCCSFDVGAFSRHDLVLHPPKAIAPHMQSSSSTGLGEGQGTDKERGPGLPSGPQSEKDEEELDHSIYCGDIEEEEIDPYSHVPGDDSEDIEPFGCHPWHRQGQKAAQKGGGKKELIISGKRIEYYSKKVLQHGF